MFSKRLSAFALLIFAAGVLFSQALISVSIGHAGRVNGIVMHPELPFAFTAGEDGRVLRWDLTLDALVQQAKLADAPLTQIAHHPSRNQITVFARESLGSGTLIVWDWEDEQIVFERVIDGVPQFVGYSPGGTFLVVATNDFDSLSFLSSQTGNPRDNLTEGFGAVSFVQIARSERNILTYVPTRGELIYWELQTGRELQVVRTERRVEGLTLIDAENQRLLAGYTDEAVVVLDNLTGAVEARLPLSPVLDLAYSAETDTIYVLTERFGDRIVRGYRFTNGALRPTSYRGERVAADTETIAAVQHYPTHALISGGAQGAVSIYTQTTGRPTEVGTADYLHIQGLAFVGNRLNVSAGDRIVTFTSDLFTGTADGNTDSIEMNFLRASTVSIPGLSLMNSTQDGNSLLVWGSSRPGIVWRLTGSARPVIEYQRENAGPIARVRPTDDGLLILFRDGLILLRGNDGEVRFEYRSPGAQDAVWDPDIGLVIAQTQGALFDSSIIIVDPNTGETVSMRTGAFLTRTLALDGEENVLFALSLTGEPRDATAEIVRYSGRGLTRNSVLYQSESGQTAGTISWDAETGTLFSTLPTGSIDGVGGMLDEVAATTARNPVLIASGSRILASGNADGTVSLFWKTTGSHLADIIIFPEGWIVTAGRGFLASSASLERYLKVIPLTESARSTQLSDLKLNLPLLIRPDF